MQNVPDIQRQHDADDGKDKNRNQRDQRDHEHDNAILADVTQTILESALALFLFFRGADSALWKAKHRDDQG